MQRDWSAIIEERRQQIDAKLREAIGGLRTAPEPLVAAMEYGLLAPGKRVRPILCGLACEALGGSFEDSLKAGCAVEMVHAYSLIHDDLPAMDNDDLRRGQPTVHVRFGETLAILAGDALLTLAFQLLAEGYPTPIAAACSATLARAAGPCGMVGGQVEDLSWEGKVAGPPRVPSYNALQSVHAAKTGALLRASVRLGCIVGRGGDADDCSDRDFAAMDEYGQCFGLVFQITDDLLDVEGEAAVTGKRVGKDAGRGKLTYPGLLGIESSREKAHQLTQRAKACVDRFGAPGEGLAWMVEALLSRRK